MDVFTGSAKVAGDDDSRGRRPCGGTKGGAPSGTPPQPRPGRHRSGAAFRLLFIHFCRPPPSLFPTLYHHPNLVNSAVHPGFPRNTYLQLDHPRACLVAHIARYSQHISRPTFRLPTTREWETPTHTLFPPAIPHRPPRSLTGRAGHTTTVSWPLFMPTRVSHGSMLPRPPLPPPLSQDGVWQATTAPLSQQLEVALKAKQVRLVPLPRPLDAANTGHVGRAVRGV